MKMLCNKSLLLNVREHILSVKKQMQHMALNPGQRPNKQENLIEIFIVYRKILQMQWIAKMNNA